MRSVWEDLWSPEFPETLQREREKKEFQEEESRGTGWVLLVTAATVQTQRERNRLQSPEERNEKAKKFRAGGALEWEDSTILV